MKCPVEITSAHIVYDRSRATIDWDCPRKRYWQYEHDGTGVVPEADAVELFTGTILHTALAAIAKQHKAIEYAKWWSAEHKKASDEGTWIHINPSPNLLVGDKVDIDAIATEAANAIYAYHCPLPQATEVQIVYGKEQATLVYGLLKGFFQHTWPQMMEKYDIVAMEEEMFFVHDQHGKGDLKAFFVMMVKPDLVLRDKLSGELVYLEYKSTSSKRENWIAQWEDAVQVHSTLNAIHQSLGERPTCCIVQGLYKGYESYGKQSSPFCYAYRKLGQPPFSKDEISYEYKNGLRRIPTWEMEGGAKQWVENMPSAILADQFPQTPPIFPNDELITDFFMQRAMRELEIKMSKQILDTDGVDKKVVLNGCYPQRFDRCKPPYGNAKPCQNRILCHGCISNPLKAGFTKRIPHHELEHAQAEAELRERQLAVEQEEPGYGAGV